MNRVNCKTNSFIHSFIILTLIFLFNFCAEKKPSEPTELPKETTLLKSVNTNPNANLSVTSDSVKIKDKDKDKGNIKGGIGPNLLATGWKYVTEYVLDHYEANGEFGILPTEYRQYAGSSGNPNRITKLNELKSKWGFNYIAASIGVYENIQAIVNAGFPISTNYLAGGFTTGGELDRATVQNLNNGLAPNTHFWGYYFDEPYSFDANARVTQSSFKSFRDFVKGIHPNSLFGFGETYYIWANRYTHNPYLWVDGFYYINYHPTQVDFTMCTRYISWLGTSIDQRTLWDDFKSIYSNVFARTWIAAHSDGSEFRNLLGYCRDQGYVPWFYQKEDGTDYDDQMISSYCQAAWLEGFLRRFDKVYLVLYRCNLNHIHDPNNPAACNWEEYSRSFQEIVQR